MLIGKDRGLYSGGICFGDSGGGVFNNDGYLIGVINAVRAVKCNVRPKENLINNNEKKEMEVLPVWHQGIFTPVSQGFLENLWDSLKK